MTEVKVIHGDGSKDILTHVRSEVERALDKQEAARVRIPRGEANNVTFDEGEDRVFVQTDGGGTKHFGGVLRETVRRDVQVELDVESFERYAKDARPSPPKQSYTNANDDTIVSDAVDAVPDLKQGTINNVESDITIVFSHATQALKIRLMRDAANAELQYNADRTVDYKSSLGSDKTGTTLSPGDQNVTDFRVTHDGGKNKKTHLRVIGSGLASVELIADNFDSSSERAQWGRAYFKQVADPTTLKKLGKKLINELQTVWTEVDATITGSSLDPQLGDKYHVKYPEHNIDDNLRIVEMTEVRDPSGTHYRCAFSNRSLGRNRDVESRTQQVVSDEGRTTSGNNPKALPTANIPVTKVPSGSTIGTKVAIPEGYVMYLWSMGLQDKNGSVPTDTSVQLRQLGAGETDGTLIREVKQVWVPGSPLATIDATSVAKLAELRIDNSSGSTHNLSAQFGFTLELERPSETETSEDTSGGGGGNAVIT